LRFGLRGAALCIDPPVAGPRPNILLAFANDGVRLAGASAELDRVLALDDAAQNFRAPLNH